MESFGKIGLGKPPPGAIVLHSNGDNVNEWENQLMNMFSSRYADVQELMAFGNLPPEHCQSNVFLYAAGANAADAVDVVNAYDIQMKTVPEGGKLGEFHGYGALVDANKRGFYKNDPVARPRAKTVPAKLDDALKCEKALKNDLKAAFGLMEYLLDDDLKHRLCEDPVYKGAKQTGRPDVGILVIRAMIMSGTLASVAPTLMSLNIINMFTELHDLRIQNGSMIQFITEFKKIIVRLHRAGFNAEPESHTQIDHLYAGLMLRACQELSLIHI